MKARHESSILLFFALFILISFMSVYVFSNLLNFKICYLNPEEKNKTIIMPFWYPDLDIGGDIYLAREIYGAIFLNYTGRLAEQQVVNMLVEMSGTEDFVHNITKIVVRFQGANIIPKFDMNTDWYIEEYFQGVILHRTDNPPKHLGFYADVVFEGERTMTWLTEGYYYPTIIVHYADSSKVEQPLNDYTIHINSIDVLREEEYNRVNIALSVSLFGLAIIGSIDIFQKIIQWRKNEIKKKSDLVTNEEPFIGIDKQTKTETMEKNHKHPIDTTEKTSMNTIKKTEPQKEKRKKNRAE